MSVNHMLSNFQQQIFIHFLRAALAYFSTSVHDSVVLFLFRKRGMLENGLLLRQVIKDNIFSMSQDTVCLLIEIFASVQRQTLCKICGEGFTCRLQPYYTHKKHTSCNKPAANLLFQQTCYQVVFTLLARSLLASCQRLATRLLSSTDSLQVVSSTYRPAIPQFVNKLQLSDDVVAT